jgi:hypothetical protein
LIDSRPPHPSAAVDAALLARLAELEREGGAIWRRFDREVRRAEFHPFVPADYGRMLALLLELRAPGLRFLEWGSATGVITIMADLLGFEACGIELDPELVEIARGLAGRFGSRARFAAGSFVPAGWRWTPGSGDARTGTIGSGVAGYAELGHALDHFDLVYAYPWDGEEPMMHDLLRARGRPGARLVLHGGSEGVRVYRGASREL